MSTTRVLVVEDDETVGQTVCRALRTAGLQPHLVVSFAQAREALASGGWAACSTDLTLPNSDGLAVVRECVAAGVPVVVFTGHGDDALRYEALAQGAAEFFTKPLDIAKVAPALWRLIRAQEAAVTDANVTIPPKAARKAGVLSRLSGATRQQAALSAERKAKAAEAPFRAFLAGAGRKVVGLGIAWWGSQRLDAAGKVQGADKYVALALAVLAIVIGLMAIMPDITMTVLRFFGLGGLVDKVLKRKMEEPPA